MKKIVMGLAAVAMAASMFAVDVAAQLKLGTNIYTNKTDDAGKPTEKKHNEMFSTPASAGWDNNNTYFKLSGSTDKAGAEICVSKEDAAIYGYSLWFQPVDALKITVGNNTVGTMTKGAFAWWAQTAKLENVMGIKANATFGSCGIEFLSSDAPLLDFQKSGYAMLGNFWLGTTFGFGDAGDLQLFVTKGAALNAYGVGGWSHTAGLAFGAAYNHTPWEQTGFYGDVVVNMKDDFTFDEVAGQVGGQFINDGLALRLVVPYAYSTEFAIGFVAKASYAIDAYTPYIQLLGNGIMDKTLGVEVGVDTKVGSCAINAAFNTTVNFSGASAFEFAIPVSFTVAF